MTLEQELSIEEAKLRALNFGLDRIFGERELHPEAPPVKDDQPDHLKEPELRETYRDTYREIYPEAPPVKDDAPTDEEK